MAAIRRRLILTFTAINNKLAVDGRNQQTKILHRKNDDWAHQISKNPKESLGIGHGYSIEFQVNRVVHQRRGNDAVKRRVFIRASQSRT